MWNLGRLENEVVEEGVKQEGEDTRSLFWVHLGLRVQLIDRDIDVWLEQRKNDTTCTAECHLQPKPGRVGIFRSEIEGDQGPHIAIKVRAEHGKQRHSGMR